MRPLRRPGFTLVEMLIVMAVTAILAAVAWPAFTSAMQKSRRSDAMGALAKIAQAQERWRANNPSYQNDLSLLPGAQNLLTSGGHYDLSLANVTAAGYQARASVHSSSPQTGDAQCQVLQVELNQGNMLYRSYNSTAAGTTDNGAQDPCWAR